jgi:hypothetical protein
MLAGQCEPSVPSRQHARVLFLFIWSSDSFCWARIRRSGCIMAEASWTAPAVPPHDSLRQLTGLPYVKPPEGAWTRAADVCICLLPFVFLFITTAVPRVRLKPRLALPLAAALMWAIRMAYLDLDSDFTNATVLFAMFVTLIPLSVVAGTICLFEAMEQTQVRRMPCRVLSSTALRKRRPSLPLPAASNDDACLQVSLC